MSRPKKQPLQWTRILCQTQTLVHKNFLIFYTSPVSTIIRALIFPLLATAVLCSLKYIQSTSSTDAFYDSGFSDGALRIRDLSAAMNQLGRSKLVFVFNGTDSTLVEPVVESMRKLQGMERMTLLTTEKTEDLFDLCQQSLVGRSNCYAAVIFATFDDTEVEYTIAADESTAQDQWWGNWRAGGDGMDKFIYPLQWALNSQIAGIDDSLRPSTRLYSGQFGLAASIPSNTSTEGGPKFWLSMVAMFVGPFFILALIGVVYHLATFVATERESLMSELMSSQEVTIVPRIASTMISFAALYLPGIIFSSVIMSQVLFMKTSAGLILILTILAGLSFVTFSHFVGSFFNKTNIAGLYSSTFVFAISLTTIATTLKYYEPIELIMPMGLLFPPFLWATLIEDIALRETANKGFGMTKLNREIDPITNAELSKVQFLTGSFYFIFFIVQIFGYAIATYLVERYLWAVKRSYDRIESSSDVAVRCTGLTKTYHGKRRWYWPFSRTTSPVVAVANLNLEVKKGSVTFLLGPNGGGKTTTLKCIAGMTAMDTGSRLELNEDGVVFGICPQQNVFWPGLTVKQHIDIWTRLKTAAQNVDFNDDVIAECDLVDKTNARAGTLSGGQMRKLQLAIAFCGGSKVCCIDEASSGLDPLSRRSIWNIIQKGHAQRTILVTTHFLDEADVLADHIVVVYKGRLVCEGSTTTLKARYGDNYVIRNDALDLEEEDDTMIWRTSNSAEATRKLLELEKLDNDNTYDVVFPTLEQVFLKVTADTAVHGAGDDGFVGEMDTATVIEEKIFALDTEFAANIDLDIGAGSGFFRQIRTLFGKRYMLLKQRAGWIGYAINLAIPIIIAAAIAKFLRDFKDLNTCQDMIDELRNTDSDFYSNGMNTGWPVLQPWEITTGFWYTEGEVIAYLGPEAVWSDARHADIYINALGNLITVYNTSGDNLMSPYVSDPVLLRDTYLASRNLVSSIDDIIPAITNRQTYFNGFGIWSPPDTPATILHATAQDFSRYGAAVTMLNLVTGNLINSNSNDTMRRFGTRLNTFQRPITKDSIFTLPITILIAVAFVAAASIAIIYPAYERLNHVRALQYCNGVAPAALWLGYLLFDIQFIVVEAVIVWGVMYAGDVSRLYYESSYVLGIFILFGIATYLGTYLFSLFVKKAAFAIAAGVHITLMVLYLISYVLIEQVGNKDTRHAAYSALQYGFGLSSPAANLLRGLWIASNAFSVLCGQMADNDTSNPMAYVRYGSVYTNLIVQIIFLLGVLFMYEYGSADFIRRVTNRAVPSRLHYRVETVQDSAAANEKTTGVSSANPVTEILKVSSISKYFGKSFAVENVSFDINANETLALLGGNGAGKTTTINMIRGEVVPNFGDIFLNGTSVLRHPAQARLQMGVCPQDDAVDNLTVLQTLRFYATVKGLKNVEGNVLKVLTALNISSYSELLVRELSGGTKRKLSVAIALLGNPRLLLLDEPSTGQDAGAKRILWKALKNVSANRAILLTTHSMEEASALATNVAIMGTRMLATGTLSTLQQRYGGAFVVRAVRAPETDALIVEQTVKQLFDNGVKEYSDSHGQVTFTLPHVKSALGIIMKTMEELKGQSLDVEMERDSTALEGSSRGGGASAAHAEKGTMQCFTDYTINGPTLEEVFMNVARESGVVGEV